MKKVMLWMSCLALAGPLNAQQETGEIHGKIIDAKTKKPMDYVSVAIVTGSTLKATAISDDEGNYIIKGLKPGTYTIKVTSLAYTTHITENIEVRADVIAFQNISMELSSNRELPRMCCFCFVTRPKDYEKAKADIDAQLLVRARDEYALEKDQDFPCALKHQSRNLELQFNKTGTRLFNEMMVFPNPANTYTNVESRYDGNKLLVVYSLSGAKVFEGTIVHHAVVSTDRLPQGVYIVTILDPATDEKTHTKLIVTH